MRRFARIAGETLVWVLAVVGVLAGALWAGNAVGWVQPLIVTSGSMSPGIQKGDLLIAVAQPVEQVEVGQLATLSDPVMDRFVTHRVIAVDDVGGGREIRMRGDANGAADPNHYEVDDGATIWHPVLTLPGAGDVVTTLSRPMVALPLGVAVVALIALSLLPPRPVRRQPVPVEEVA